LPRRSRELTRGWDRVPQLFGHCLGSHERGPTP
jgi:hypothetical protein